MNLRSPKATTTVAYFFLLTLAVAFCSMASPLPFGTVREIPQSPVWSEPLVVCTLPPVIRTPSFAVDSSGTVNVVYCDRVNDYPDLFYVTIKERTISDGKNLTDYPSLKESAQIGMNADQIYVAFLDNREGSWQIFLLNVNESELVQLTDTASHKEDLSLDVGLNNLVVTWTDMREGKPRIFLSVVDFQGNIIVDQQCLCRDYPSTKASLFCDNEKIHIVYLEKQVYDHITYAQVTYTGDILAAYDLGENTHLDPEKLGVFKGPQFVVADTILCVWSDSRTGSQDLYYTEFTENGDVITDATKLTAYPFGAWSWMPSVTAHDESIHIVYLNNGFGHRLFHSYIEDGGYQELGTVTSRSERATAPSVVSDGEGLYCMYLQFGEGGSFNLAYRDTYPAEEKKVPFSEKIEQSSIRYVYSLGLSFLFAFPLTAKDNFIAIVLLFGGFLVFRFFKLREPFKKWKGSEYFLLVVCIVVFTWLRGPIEYSLLVHVVYDRMFVTYGIVLSSVAAVLFKYLLGTRLDFEVRILLSSLVYLYFSTLFFLLPIIEYI
ncbi:MAG: hypothetical protein HXS46_11200 [Theionarchaea archaeon]|nr:hypothetical protein [Theionarchaea archaeon]